MNPNPYIGPRPFDREDQDLFFGRDAETAALVERVTAHREVLVYSPAGAGKTSLLNARLIPALIAQGMTVLPLARVGVPLPPGVGAQQVGNVFVYSALLSLYGERASVAGLAGLALKDGLRPLLEDPAGTHKSTGKTTRTRRAVPKGPAQVVIFDQFEELLTAHPERISEARGFFEQLAAALEAYPRLVAVLAFRETCLAALEPYLALLPGTARAHFRLEGLNPSAALAAVTGPARVAGVTFADDLASRLVEDMCRTSDLPDPAQPVVAEAARQEVARQEVAEAAPQEVAPQEAARQEVARQEVAQQEVARQEVAEQEVAAEETPLAGETALPIPEQASAPPVPAGMEVEPVLLQVVCSQLWANLPDGTREIGAQDLQRSAAATTVDQALCAYYETAVRTAAAVGGVSEGDVRRWFSQTMITPQGGRGMASQDLLETGGLSNLAVLELEDLHLLIAHVWGGVHWYELAQERFIEPIRASNAAWEQSLVTPLRITARHWKQTGEPGLLYTGQALKAARTWADSAALNGPGEVEPDEWAFIQAGEKAARAVVTLRGWIVSGVLALVLLAVILGLLTRSAQQRAAVASLAQLNLQKERATAVMNAQQANQQRASALQSEEAAQRAQADAQRQAQSSAAREYAALGSQALNQELPQASLLLALQSVRQSQQAGELRSVAGEQALRDALGKVSGIPLQGHTLAVNNLASSPDRRWLATVSDDGSLRLWDLNAGDPGAGVIVLDPGQGWLGSVAFSVDGRWLAAAGADAVIHVWDMAPANTAGTSGQALQQMQAQTALLLKGHTASIEGLYFSPDGHWLVSASTDKTVRLWSVTKLPVIPDPVTLSGPTESLITLDISADSRWAAAGGRSGAVWVWDLSAKDPSASARQMSLQDRVNSLAFSPDSHWLAAGGLDHNVVLWDLRLANPAAQPVGLGQHAGAVLSLDFSPDGCWLASGGADNKIFLWFMGVQGASGFPGQIFYALNGHTGGVNSLDFPKMIGPRDNYQANRLVSGSADHTVRVWDLTPVAVSGKDCRRPAGTNGQPQPMPDVRLTDLPVMVLRGLDGAVQKVDIVAGNRWLAAAGADSSARLWDLRALSPSLEPFQFDAGDAGHLYADAVSRDGKWLAAAGQHGVFAWSLQDLTAAPASIGCTKNGAYSLAAGPGGLMAAGCLDGSVLLWNTAQLPGGATFTPQGLQALQGVVYSVAVSADGQWLAAGDETGKLVAWRLVNGAPQGDPLTLMADGDTVYSLLFDAQSRWLASADAKGRVRLWNPAGGASAELATFQASSAPAYTLAASPDGRWLAAGTWDRAGVVRLWDMRAFIPGKGFAGGKEPPAFTLGGFINRVYALAFSPDGKWLAAGSADFTLRQWDLTRLAALDPAQNPKPDPHVYATLLDDHHDLVFQAIYSPNSRWLISASADTTLRQWDTQDPQALPVVFNGHTAWVRMLAVTPDGRYVISVSEDGTIRRWALSLDDLERTACQLTRRNLSTAEANRYLHGSIPEATCAPAAP